MFKKVILSLIGINIMSFGLNILLVMNVGVGPVDTLSLVIQKILSIKEYGNANLIFHLIFFIGLIAVGKIMRLNIKKIDLFYSILSIFLVTRVVNLYGSFEFYNHLNSNVILFICAFLILNFGLYCIARANLLISPYDKFVVEFAKATKSNVGSMRVILDIILLLVSLVVILITRVDVALTFMTIFITIFTGLNIKFYIALENMLYKKKD